jgi:beta-lactam-binding protein with PASTA domain
VISQSPAGGQKKQKQTPVTLTVSTGKEAVEIPDVSNNSPSTAANQLGKLGFKTEQQDEFSNDIGKGKVTRTNPPAGTKADPASTTVVIIVSAGPQTTTTASTSTTTTTTKPTPTTPTTDPGTTTTKPKP